MSACGAMLAFSRLVMSAPSDASDAARDFPRDSGDAQDPGASRAKGGASPSDAGDNEASPKNPNENGYRDDDDDGDAQKPSYSNLDFSEEYDEF